MNNKNFCLDKKSLHGATSSKENRKKKKNLHMEQQTVTPKLVTLKEPIILQHTVPNIFLPNWPIRWLHAVPNIFFFFLKKKFPASIACRQG